MSREEEAKALIKKANELQTPGFFKKLFSSEDSRLEESLECLEKAANIYKLLKKWEEAGKCMEDCANIEVKLKADAAQFFIEAGHCYSFVDKKKSIEMNINAINQYVGMGRYQQAGKIQKQIAEKYEEDLQYENSAMSFKKAADYFSMESQSSKSYEQGCLLKYADILCQTNSSKSFPEASDVRFFLKKIYEKIGLSYLNVTMLKPSAKDLFFKAFFVHLAYGSVSTADDKYKLYTSEDPTMLETREDQFMKAALIAVSEKNIENYKSATTKYKNYTDFDKWKINVFDKIYKDIDKQVVSDDFLG